MRLNRYIAGFFILCFSAFLGHNLIPHHHYPDLFGSPVSSACPLQHGNQSGHHDQGCDEDLPCTHCHAFNDVVLEKYNAPVTFPARLQAQLIIIPGQVRIPELPTGNTRSLDNSHALTGYDEPAMGIRTLRAPPSFG